MQEVQLQEEVSERFSAELQQVNAEAPLAAEALCESTVKPLEQELHCMFHEVQELQEEFLSEMAEEDRRGQALEDSVASTQGGKALEVEERLHAEATELRHEVAQERVAAEEAAAALQHRSAGLEEQLAEHRASLAARMHSCRQLESECQAATQEEHQSRCSLEAAERRLEAAQETRQLGIERLAQRRAALWRRHAQELAGMRRAREPAASKPMLLLQQSLSSISSVPTLDDADSLVTDGPSLVGRAKLVERAQQLGL